MPPLGPNGERAKIVVAGRTLEVGQITTGSDRCPIVLLHEGLGSIDMWRDFPDRLARTTGRDVVVYSRYGHGRSERLREARNPAYMHEEARVALRGLLAALGVAKPVLFGHSDGGSIALIYAATFPGEVEALVLEAPHVFVETLTVEGIARAKAQASDGDLLAKLGRYHDDPQGTFTGWNDIWLQPEFAAWNITELLPAVAPPVLTIQGRNDAYGSEKQLAAIAAGVPHSTAILLDECGHSPHRDHPDAVLEHVRTFLADRA